MQQDEIVIALTDLIEALKSPLTKSIQFAVTKNITAIEACLANGVSRKDLISIINKAVGSEKIKSTDIFKQLLVRARKRKSPVQPTLSAGDSCIQKNDNPGLRANEKNGATDGIIIETKEWFAVNITRQPLIKRLTENGYSPSDVKSWGCNNESQVSSYLTALLMRNR